MALRRLGGDAQEVLPMAEAVARLAAEAAPPDLVRRRIDLDPGRPDARNWCRLIAPPEWARRCGLQPLWEITIA